MPKRASQPSLAVIVLLLTAAAATAILAGAATTADDAVARILFTIALITLACSCMLVRHRDRRARRSQGDPSRADPPSCG